MVAVWLVTLPAAAVVGGLGRLGRRPRHGGTVLVAAVTVAVAGGIYGLSRRKPVTVATVNDLPVPRPVPVAAQAVA